MVGEFIVTLSTGVELPAASELDGHDIQFAVPVLAPSVPIHVHAYHVGVGNGAFIQATNPTH